MGNTKDFDIKQFQIWKVKGNFKQPDHSIIENMTMLILETVDKGSYHPFVVMGLFKAKNDNYKLWEKLEIDLEEKYLAGDCLYTTMPDSIQGDKPLYEIKDAATKQKIKDVYMHNFD